MYLLMEDTGKKSFFYWTNHKRGWGEPPEPLRKKSLLSSKEKMEEGKKIRTTKVGGGG